MKAQALVARNLRRLRVRQNLSQENLAVDAGVDLSYVSRLERGLENPTVGILERLGRALDAEIIEFFAAPARGEIALMTNATVGQSARRRGVVCQSHAIDGGNAKATLRRAK